MSRRRCIAFALAALALLAGPVRAESPPAELEPGASCVAAGCHTGVADDAVQHWDDVRDECVKCHVAQGGKHEFETAELPELCMDCHESVADESQIHDPAEEGCDDCHDPHSSPHAGLLVAEGNALCAECHDDITDAVEQAEFSHDPAEDDCTNCHDPHSGPHPYMLAKEKRGVCNECHDDIVEQAERAAVDHSPTISGQECVGCHSPHASDVEFLLKEPVRELCLGCHDKPVESGASTLLDLKAWLARKPHQHEPVQKGECAECHDPHGSENFRLLRESFPETFYGRFEVSRYALCFSCHEKSLATEKRTRSETSFRNGDLNLHNVHLDRKQRGRSCRACHDVHASEGPFQVRNVVPYGSWSMPIRFQESESGGSCQPGCHEKKSYDRKSK